MQNHSRTDLPCSYHIHIFDSDNLVVASSYTFLLLTHEGRILHFALSPFVFSGKLVYTDVFVFTALSHGFCSRLIVFLLYQGILNLLQTFASNKYKCSSKK